MLVDRSHLPLEERAEVLLLGCGDPRNILFTLHHDQARTAGFDFTCCDYDSATIARNVLLLTLFLKDDQGKNVDLIWSIFYDIWLSKEAYNLLCKHSKDIYPFTESLATWRESTFGSAIHFVSSSTLAYFRDLLESFIESFESGYYLSAKARDRFQNEIKKIKAFKPDDIHSTTYTIVSGGRSGGFLAADAVMPMSEHFHYYWEKGVVCKSDVQAANVPNPTMRTQTSDSFSLHYATQPLLGYTVASGLVPMKVSKICTTLQRSAVGFDSLAASAREQFRSWSRSFRSAVTAGRVQIRLHAGEAFQFSKSLHGCILDRRPVHYQDQWTSMMIELDEESYGSQSRKERRAPTTFNVIDTSNLTDHLGIYNILANTVPLLSLIKQSFLVTDTLLEYKPGSSSPYDVRLGCNVEMVSLLLNLCPTGYLSGVTGICAMEEWYLESLSGEAISGARQLRERLVWTRNATDCDQRTTVLTIDQDLLVKFLIKVYRHMFSNETPSFGFLSQGAAAVQSHISCNSLLHYTRAGFVDFIKLLAPRIAGWSVVVDKFLARLELGQGTMMSLNNYQDLCAQLQLNGLYHFDVMNVRQNTSQASRFKTWSFIPPLVTLHLIIPPADYNKLWSFDTASLSGLILRMEVHAGGLNNPFGGGQSLFSGIHAVFGSATLLGLGTDSTLHIEQDHSGPGRSDLIVSASVPAWILQEYPNNTAVNLQIQSTLGSARMTSQFGLRMVISETALHDQARVIITPLVQAVATTESSASRPHKKAVGIVLDSESLAVDSMSQRNEIISDEARAALRGGANVVLDQNDDPESSTFSASFDTHKLEYTLPLKAKPQDCKLRVARASGYIELVAKPAKHSDHLAYLHNLPLDALPSLNLAIPLQSFANLETQAGFALAADERELLKDTSSIAAPAISQMKASIVALFQGFQQRRGEPTIFGLTRSTFQPPWALIFITDARFDMHGHGVVLDAHLVSPISPIGNGLFNTDITIVTGDSEVGSVDVNAAASSGKMPLSAPQD